MNTDSGKLIDELTLESLNLSRQRYAAVLFDMDGVVTDTANAHACAWKRLFDEYFQQRAGNTDFVPFDREREYRRYVDGKPRYEGVQAMLQARGIELPFGTAQDDPARETVCGLGNRKNHYFQAWLRDHRVDVYQDTLSLIKTLHQQGFKTGIFSASRNAEQVLQNAGIEDLFDAKVDGKDLAELGLAGKPDPAMLCRCAELVDVPPQHAVIVEDAAAGIEAARRGGFGLIVGIDRGGNEELLQTAGADIVVGYAKH